MARLAADIITERGTDAAMDMALTGALLSAVASGRRQAVVRLYRPLPTVAFGRRDTFEPGFAAACAAATRHGFTPLIRAPGGRAAAYDGGCLVFDEIVPDPDAMTGIQERFSAVAEEQAKALQALGVDARVGEVPGEYCPGSFSVNARGEVKLLGGAQRVVRGCWMLSTLAVLESGSRIRAVLEDVYAALGLSWRPATVGAISDEVTSATREEIEHALRTELDGRYELTPSVLTGQEWDEARAQRARYLAS